MKIKQKHVIPDFLGETKAVDPETLPIVHDDTELKKLLKAIYEAGAIGSHRSLSDDVAAVRRLV